MDNKDKLEIDQYMSKKIMSEFKGQTIQHVCHVCNGTGICPSSEIKQIKKPCLECNGKGSYPLIW